MKRMTHTLRRAGYAALIVFGIGLGGCSDSDTVTSPNPPDMPGPITPAPGDETNSDNGLGSHGGEKRDGEQGDTGQMDPSLNP